MGNKSSSLARNNSGDAAADLTAEELRSAVPVVILHLANHADPIRVERPTFATLAQAAMDATESPSLDGLAFSCAGHVILNDDDLRETMEHLGVVHEAARPTELNCVGAKSAAMSPQGMSSVKSHKVARPAKPPHAAYERLLVVELVPKPVCETAEDQENMLMREQSATMLGGIEAQDAVTEEDEGPLDRQFSHALDATAATPTQPCDVLFVGAGPVGLWTAVQLKIMLPMLNIVMVEKHATYQRRHVVQLQPASLKQRPTMAAYGAHADALDKLCASLPCPNVRTNELEDKLTSFAIRLGIMIKIETAESLTAAALKYRPRAIIGSDGSHSIVRQGMSHGGKPELHTDWIVERTANLKYEVLDTPDEKQLTTRELYCMMKLIPSTFSLFEHIGKAGPSASDPSVMVRPITVVVGGLTVDDFEAVKGGTFRNPITLGPRFKELTPQLRAAIQGWLSAKRAMCRESLVVNSETISAVALRVYRATWFAEMMSYAIGPDATSAVPCAVALVGDAAFGVPYFRAINNGYLSGSKLAALLAKAFQKSGNADALVSAVNDYHKYMVFLATGEISRASMKQNAVDAARGMTRFNMKLPQVQKLPKEAESSVRAAVAMELDQVVNPH